MIIDDIRHTMEYVEKVTRELGYTISRESYDIEDAGCPHKQSSLRKGYAAIYIFAYESGTKYEYLKIGKANTNGVLRNVESHEPCIDIEGMYAETADEILEYTIDGVKLRDIITEIHVDMRTI